MSHIMSKLSMLNEQSMEKGKRDTSLKTHTKAVADRYDRFEDIPSFIDCGNYQVNISWGYLETQLKGMAEGPGLDLDPDFQRGHVWCESQQIRYVEFVLRGGRSSRDLYFNAPGWMGRGVMGQCVLVDGKQRIEAVRRFMRNEIPAFKTLLKDYKDKLRLIGPDFVFHVNNLPTRAMCLQWYIDLNAGGVAHTTEEIQRVRDLLATEAVGGKGNGPTTT